MAFSNFFSFPLHSSLPIWFSCYIWWTICSIVYQKWNPPKISLHSLKRAKKARIMNKGKENQPKRHQFLLLPLFLDALLLLSELNDQCSLNFCFYFVIYCLFLSNWIGSCRSTLQKYSPLDWREFFDREEDVSIPNSNDVSVWIDALTVIFFWSCIIALLLSANVLYHYRYFMCIRQETKDLLFFVFMGVAILGMISCFFLFLSFSIIWYCVLWKIIQFAIFFVCWK